MDSGKVAGKASPFDGEGTTMRIKRTESMDRRQRGSASTFKAIARSSSRRLLRLNSQSSLNGIIQVSQNEEKDTEENASGTKGSGRGKPELSGAQQEVTKAHHHHDARRDHKLHSHASVVRMDSAPVMQNPHMIPSRLVRQVAVGFSMTLMCTTDGQCYQWGTTAGIFICPSRVPELKEQHVLYVAVGPGKLEPDANRLEVAAAAAKLARKSKPSKNGQKPASNKGKTSKASGNLDQEKATITEEERINHFKNMEETGAPRRYDDEDHMCVITDAQESNLWTWGGNSHGQLGRGNCLFSGIPTRLSFGPDHHERVATVTCGHKFTIAVTETNHVWGFGKNDCGQLGLATMRNEYSTSTSSWRSTFRQDRSSRKSDKVTVPTMLSQLNAGYPKGGDLTKQDPFGPYVFMEERLPYQQQMSFSADGKPIGVVAKSSQSNSQNSRAYAALTEEEGPPGSSENVDSSMSIPVTSRYTQRDCMCVAGVDHAIMWTTTNDLPAGVSAVLAQMEEDGYNLDATDAMIADREEELALLRPPEDSEAQTESSNGTYENDMGELLSMPESDDDNGDNASDATRHLDRRRRRMLMTVFGGAVESDQNLGTNVVNSVDRGDAGTSAANPASSLEPPDEELLQQLSQDEEMDGALSLLVHLERNIKLTRRKQALIIDATKRLESEAEDVSSQVMDTSTNVRVLQDFVEDVSRLAHTSQDKPSESKTIQDNIIAVADDNTQLVESNQTVLDRTEMNHDRVVRNLVLLKRQKVSQEAVLKNLRNEHKIVMCMATSRAKILMRKFSEVGDGVDAFDVADLLQSVSRGIVNARPENILENDWRHGVPSPVAEKDTIRHGNGQSNLYSEAAREGQMRTKELMDSLSACISSGEFVHEFGSTEVRADKGMMSLLPGDIQHTLSKASRHTGGTSAAYELLKLGRSILVDTVQVERKTQQIACNLVSSPW